MSAKPKRSNGGYGLRRKAVKKKWDDDFEYYFSKTKPGQKGVREIIESKVKLIPESEAKSEVSKKDGEESPKRSRGRPRKNQEVVETQVRKEEEIPLKKRGRRPEFSEPKSVIKISEVNEDEEPNAAELVEELKSLEKRKKYDELKAVRIQAVKQKQDSDLKRSADSVRREKVADGVKKPKVEVPEKEKRPLIFDVPLIEKQKTHEVKEKNEEEKVYKEGASPKTMCAKTKEEPAKRSDISQLLEIAEEQTLKACRVEKDEGKENKPHHEIQKELIVQGVESDEENVILNMTIQDSETICEEEVISQDASQVNSASLNKKVSSKKVKKEVQSPTQFKTAGEYSGEDKVECDECHKLLKPSSFRQHLRTHTGVKPFECEVCNARFTRKGDVERHVRIVHHKHKPFKCCRCQRAFGDKKNLRWHLMNHDKKLFYICEVCGFKFGKREYWENHVRFIHPVSLQIDQYMNDGSVAVIPTKDSEKCEDAFGTLAQSLIGATAEEGAIDDPSYEISDSQRTDNAVHELVRAEQADVNEREGNVPSELSIKTISRDQSVCFNKEQDRNHHSRYKTGIKIHATHLQPEESMALNQVVSKTEQQGPMIQQVMSVKNISMSDIVRIAQASQNRMSNLHSCAEGRQQDEIEAVVIHLDESSSPAASESSRNSPQLRAIPANLYRVITTDVGQIVQENCEEPEQIVVETPDYFETNIEVEEDRSAENEEVVDTSGGGDASYQVKQEQEDSSPRVISIVVKENQDTSGGGDGNSSVQTLIEALLDAAKGDAQHTRTTVASDSSQNRTSTVSGT